MYGKSFEFRKELVIRRNNLFHQKSDDQDLATKDVHSVILVENSCEYVLNLTRRSFSTEHTCFAIQLHYSKILHAT